MYLFFDQPLIILAIVLPIFLLMLGIAREKEQSEKPATISRKKTKQLVRKAVKANEIPQQFRRYNF